LGPGSVSLPNVHWEFPTTIVVGQELRGIPPDLLSHATVHAAIPMYGLVTSLNVAIATVLAVDSAVKAYREVDPEFLPIRPDSLHLV
jgi:tRNA (guanosine-2'-O-)-methyltransferase